MNATEREFASIVVRLRKHIRQVEHQSCGVDSYSVEDFARESMSIEGVTSTDEITLGYSDDEYRDMILVMETIRWVRDIEHGMPLTEVLAQIDEAYNP